MELCDGSYSLPTIIAQMLASTWISGDCTLSTVLDEVKMIVEQVTFLMDNETDIWPSLLPGGIPADAPSMQFAVITMAELAKMTGEMNLPLDTGNIQLDYKIRVYFSAMETVLYADGAEVFMDEQKVQWIKFWPTNGPGANHENIMRTDGIVIVRENGMEPDSDD
jgi:hypothetical protein